MKSRIPYVKPSITEREVAYATEAARNGWGSRCYEYVDRFEVDFREHLGVRNAVSTSSCTGALHMGLHALDIGHDDEVIMADTNWVATVAPVVHLGAKPVFVDILEDTWCLDPAKVEEAISPKTKAIIATHLYGNLCDMDALLAIGEMYDVAIIEDAAEAIGSCWRTRRAGSMGRFGAFSFHGSKTVTTGEGGMFVTSDDQLYHRVLTLSNHGRSRSQKKQFWPDEIGFKYKLSNLAAAIGCGQMERIDELIARKREILSGYRERFHGINTIRMNPEPRQGQVGAWMPSVVFAEETRVTREELLSAFAAENIDARVFFYPLSALSMFESKKKNRNAWSISERAINLPSFHDMTEEEIDRVSSVIYGLLNDNRS